MSIKSQKSLNEELSEIIERSYSVRSPSLESLSGEDEDECLARELMKKLTPAVLSKLRRCFKKNKDRSNKSQDIDRRVEEVMRLAAAEEGIEFAQTQPPPDDALWLDEIGFVTALDKIFGHHRYTTHSHKLFHVLDSFSSGKVWWRQLVARLVAVGARATSSRAEVWKPLKHINIKKLEHCKRETLVKLVSLEREESFCYVAVTRGGRVGVYSGDLRLINSYEMFHHRRGAGGRVKNRWVTDVLYLQDVQYLVLAASDRSLTMYDVTTLSHNPIICITGIPNIPMCMAYYPSVSASDTSELALGTELGEIIRIKFLQPRLQFMHVNTTDHINYYFWMELTSPPHTSHISITQWKRVHSRSVRRMRYMGPWLLSCSHDAVASLRLRHVPGLMDDYVLKVLRGVSCFHTVPSLHTVAAGGADGAVRLWQPATHAPFATLCPPAASSAPVLDVLIVAAQEILIAYCSNCTVHIWDIYEECLLQSIKIKFPFLGVLGKKVEFGPYCIHSGPVRKDPEESISEITDFPMSRRASSVYQGSTGGLMLQLNQDDLETMRKLEEETEYSRYNRAELLFTSCDYVCTIAIGKVDGEVLGPPADNLRARRPSTWDLHDCADDNTNMPSSSLAPATRPQWPVVPTPLLLSPSSAEMPQTDLDTLLENAGLQGILEKDFVLMQGLKNDLNRTLAEIEANKEELMNAVNMGAPYLALKMYEPSQMEPVDEMYDRYKKVMSVHSIIVVSLVETSFTVPEEYDQNQTAIPGIRASLAFSGFANMITTSLAYKVGKQVISLAEGMPNENVFPFTRLRLETRSGKEIEMRGKDLASALQYMPSQGLPSLLTELRKFQEELHRPPQLPRDIMVTNGSQHGIYQCVELLVEPGDPVITTEYTYGGIHSTLKPYQPEIIGIPEDEDGLIPETLDSVLGERLHLGLKMPKMLYIIPTGNNPSGTLLPEHRRRQIYELSCKYDFIIIEDDPYMFLNYTNSRIPSFLSMDTHGRVIRLDSVSKVVSAGLRGAWVTAPTPLLQRLELHMQAELLHPCTLSQAILLQLLSDRSALARHLDGARQLYQDRRDALNSALEPIADLVPYTIPKAGLFFWIRVNGVSDVYKMVFHTALERGLMLIPGQAFMYDSNSPSQHLRLTFSRIRLEDMDTAVRHLAELIRDEQQMKTKMYATDG